jgi:hypothetical protein
VRALIDVPFRDATAADLCWSLRPGGSGATALATLDVDAATGPVRLAVLGASHAVEIGLADGDRVTETVACGVAGGHRLGDAPDRVDDHGIRYRFSVHVDEAGTDAVVALSDELHDLLAPDPSGLVAAFPGVPGATTALRALVRPDGVSWDTWHLYPERGEIVRTRSSVAVPTLAGAVR